MLIVRVILSPRIGSPRILAEGHIYNVETGSEESGNYAALFWEGDPSNPKKGSVTGFPRFCAPVWELVRRALSSALGGRDANV